MDPALELSHHLWSLRQLLDRLIYRLEVQQLLLASGRTRFLALAAVEVDEASAAVAALEGHLRAAARAAVGTTGSDSPPPLAELVALLKEPHATAVAEHRAALIVLGVEIEELVRSNKELAKRLIQARDVLSQLSGPSAESYTPTGAPSNVHRSTHRLDQTA